MQDRQLHLILSLIFSLYWNASSSAFAQMGTSRTIDTKTTRQSQNVGQLVDYYEDKTRTQTLKDIVALDEGSWRPSAVDVPSFGFTDSRYWIRLTMAPNKDHPHWYLEVAHPLHDILTLYESGPNGPRRLATIGDRLPFNKRMIKTTNIVFEISLDPDREKTFWLSSKSESSMAFPLAIWDKNAYQNYLIQEYVVKGFYYGMIAVMGLYNLILFLSLRQLEHLKYVLYIWSSTCFQMALSGIAFQFLWPDNTWLANEGIALLAGTLCVFMVKFTQSFLETLHYARNIHKALNMLLTLGLGLMVYSFIGPHKIAIQLGNGLSLITAMMMLTVCIASIRLKIPQAKFFVLAFITFFCGVVLVVLKIVGLLPTNFLTAYGFQIGTALQVVLLSIAVGDKIRIERLQASQNIHDAHSEIKNLNKTLQVLNLGLEKTIHEKTIDLQRRNAQIETILNSLPMGVVTVDASLQIAQHSKWMTTFFATNDLAGRSLAELLLAKSSLQLDDRDRVVNAASLMVGEDEISFQVNESQLPREFGYRTSDREYILELSWNVILDEVKHIDKILLTINDVTDARHARLEAQQKSQHLTMVGEILGLSPDRFQHFIDSTILLLDEIDSMLKQDSSEETWNDALRSLHTLKGNSRAYGLSFLNNMVHQAESSLSAQDSAKTSFSHHKFQDAAACSRQIRDLVLQYAAISHDTLNRSSDLAKDKLILRTNQWLNELVKHSNLSELPHYETFRDITQKLDGFCHLSLNEMLSPLVSSLGSIALQLHKHVPHIKVIDDQNITFNKNMTHWFVSVFSHLFRNSMDHGFTKSKAGTITIEARTTPDSVQLVYRDNGQGLDLAKLVEKYAASRPEILNWNQEQLAHLIFEDNVSSKDTVSDISGRGLGMSAVKKMIETVHGTIQIELSHVSQDQFAPFAFVIQLPLTQATMGHYRASA